MLVISFDAIPTSFDEMVEAIKNIPAFIASIIQLMWIWHTHNVWSKRFGLDTTYTVVLSVALLMVVLIYIYPLRIMMAGLFGWLTNEYLPPNFALESWDQLRDMFVFLSIGFMCLCLIFVLMYRHAANMSDMLRLSELELHTSRTFQYMWLSAAAIGLVQIILALTLAPTMVPFAGFAFALMAITFPLIRGIRMKSMPKKQ